MSQKNPKNVSIEYRKIFVMLQSPLRSTKRALPMFTFGALIIAGLTVLEPYLYGQIIDWLFMYLSEGTEVNEVIRAIGVLLALWIGIVIANTLMNAGYSYWSWWVANDAVGVFSEHFYRRMLSLSVRTFERKRAGELIRRFDNSWMSLYRFIEHTLKHILLGCIIFITAVVVGTMIDWRLMLVALMPVPLIVMIGVVNYRISTPRQQELDKKWDAVFGFVGDTISNIVTVKSFLLERVSVAKIVKDYVRITGHQQRVSLIWSSADAAYGFVYTFGRLALFAAGAFLVLRGEITLGTMITFLGFTSFLFDAVSVIVEEFPNFQKYMSQLNRAQKIWNIHPEVVDAPNAVAVERVRGEIEFKGVWFEYEKSMHVLRDVDVTIPAGKIFALVGESGSGKSTMVKLMLRFMDVTKGAVFIDGNDVRGMRLDDVRGNIGFVMQENLLFHDTILSNLKLAKPNATMDEVIAAAKRAQAHEFIQRLPKGYKSKVGDRGVKLSGGEKQRIALARVFLEDPPVLVLDEATSALDSRTENALQQALKEVMKGRTTVVIAHRLSTVMAADNILVLDKGKIVDQGTHDQLVKRGGLYKQYWEIQAGGYV